MKKALVLPTIFILAGCITLSSMMASAQEDYNIPAWIKNNAAWWSEGQIDDASFVSGITYMIENGIMEISQSNTPVNNMSLDDLYQENQEFREYFENTLSDTVEYARNEQVLSEENQRLNSSLDEYQAANDGFAENEENLHAQINSLQAQLQSAQNANTGGSSSVQKIQDNGDFFVVYLEPNTAMGNNLEQEIQAWGYFEAQAQWLNSEFRLPYDVAIALTECDIGPHYDSSQRAIFMCYEFISYLDTLFYQEFNGDPMYIDETNRVIDFVFYHEVGHALIDVYELPTTGPEEDAADSFSSYIMADLTSGTGGQDSIYSAATWFWNEHYRQGVPNSAFWDTHSLNIQRYYNISCFSYGSNPIYNQDLVDEGWLPPARAMWCDKEYTQQKNSWDEILQPFFK